MDEIDPDAVIRQSVKKNTYLAIRMADIGQVQLEDLIPGTNELTILMRIVDFIQSNPT